MTFKTDIFTKFDKQWALLTAGTADHFNAMTISWGSMGTLWSRPVVTVYVRPTRYTDEFMQQSDYFTVSFYPERFRRDLAVMGSKSGRDCDKVAMTALEPCALEQSVTFRQAETTILCRKLYVQDLSRADIPAEVLESHYAPQEQPHRMYIGEVVGIYPADGDAD